MKRVVLVLVAVMVIGFALNAQALTISTLTTQNSGTGSWTQSTGLGIGTFTLADLTFTISSTGGNISAGTYNATIDGVSLTAAVLGSPAKDVIFALTAGQILALNTANALNDGSFNLVVTPPTTIPGNNQFSSTLSGNANNAVTPEPATMLLMGAGLAGLPVVRRFRKKSAE